MSTMAAARMAENYFIKQESILPDFSYCLLPLGNLTNALERSVF